MWDVICALHFEHLVVLGHKCSDHGCESVAPWLCYWPGQTSPKCERHRAGWTRVAEVMGFELVSVPLEVRACPSPTRRACGRVCWRWDEATKPQGGVVSDDCECWSPRGHLAFCPAREKRPEPVRCIGVTQWAPDNRQCMSCGRFGQSCERRSPIQTLDDVKRALDAGAKERKAAEKTLKRSPRR